MTHQALVERLRELAVRLNVIAADEGCDNRSISPDESCWECLPVERWCVGCAAQEAASALTVAGQEGVHITWDADGNRIVTPRGQEGAAQSPQSTEDKTAGLLGSAAGKSGDGSTPVDPVCRIPPYGWHCTRDAGHDGPCAAVPEPMSAAGAWPCCCKRTQSCPPAADRNDYEPAMGLNGPCEPAPETESEFSERLRHTPQYRQAERVASEAPWTPHRVKREPEEYIAVNEQMRGLLAWFVVRYRAEQEKSK